MIQRCKCWYHLRTKKPLTIPFRLANLKLLEQMILFLTLHPINKLRSIHSWTICSLAGRLYCRLPQRDGSMEPARAHPFINNAFANMLLDWPYDLNMSKRPLKRRVHQLERNVLATDPQKLQKLLWYRISESI